MATIRVSLYNPNVATLPAEEVNERSARLASVVAQAATDNASIFLAPEYFFTHNGAVIGDPDLPGCIAYSAQEFEELHTDLANLSLRYADMLIVPGTVFWNDGSEIQNVSVAYLGGESVAASTKHDYATDGVYAGKCGTGFESGDGGVSFAFQNYACYLQICTDATVAPPENMALSIVPSYKPGAAALANLNRFEARILSNGEGAWMTYSSGLRAAGTDEYVATNITLG